MTITTKNLNVGDTVHADFSKYNRVDVRAGKVLSKSATGVIKVEFDNGSSLSFMAAGHERGKGWNERGHLIDAETFATKYRAMLLQRREQRAAKAIAKLTAIPVNEANRTALIEALNAAVDAVEAI